jgi:cation diffusion facilitator CzcD-associated flavoprotein CzcO
VIAVIGGGTSGTLAAHSLLREAADRRMPLQVALIDRHGRHGLGQAYSTTHPAHLLNSPAGAMSALAGDPGHLVRWATENGPPDDGFLPRSAFGRGKRPGRARQRGATRRRQARQRDGAVGCRSLLLLSIMSSEITNKVVPLVKTDE